MGTKQRFGTRGRFERSARYDAEATSAGRIEDMLTLKSCHFAPENTLEINMRRAWSIEHSETH
jgi:hypothetical protein